MTVQGPQAPLVRFWRDERGQAVTEYILIIGLIVVPLAVAFNKLQGKIKAFFDGMAKLLYGPGI